MKGLFGIGKIVGKKVPRWAWPILLAIFWLDDFLKWVWSLFF